MKVSASQSPLVQGIKRLVWLAGVAMLWHMITTLGEIPTYILPSPGAVLKTLLEDRGILWFHAQETLFEWSLGLTLSTFVALALSWLAFESLSFEKLLNRTLVVSQSIPYLTLAPLLLLWFGLGAAPKIILILLTCTFPITQLTLNGLRNAQLEFGILAAVLRLNKNKALKRIYAPAALPQFFEGLKIAVTYAFVSSVLAELIGSEAGLGVYLSRAQSAYRTDRVMAVVIVIVFFSLFCIWLVNRIARKALYWKVEKNV
ncbi:MAG: ABC transporter permease [Betaproteobacteria bacterium]|nr:ABC transporter permease [Betaproteobacteria bacterium]